MCFLSPLFLVCCFFLLLLHVFKQAQSQFGFIGSARSLYFWSSWVTLGCSCPPPSWVLSSVGNPSHSLPWLPLEVFIPSHLVDYFPPNSTQYNIVPPLFPHLQGALTHLYPMSTLQSAPLPASPFQACDTVRQGLLQTEEWRQKL